MFRKERLFRSCQRVPPQSVADALESEYVAPTAPAM